MAQPLSASDRDYVSRWVVHENEMFTNRANFFVLAESMFFMAFATFGPTEQLAAIGVALAGLGVASVWFYVSLRNIQRTQSYWKTVLEEPFHRGAELARRRGIISTPQSSESGGALLENTNPRGVLKLGSHEVIIWGFAIALVVAWAACIVDLFA